MWQQISNPTFSGPSATEIIPSRHGIAKQTYLDKKRSQADSAGNASRRFRWARRLGFAG